jgi:sporulation protein YlmC with PRC-barrel domain
MKMNCAVLFGMVAAICAMPLLRADDTPSGEKQSSDVHSSLSFPNAHLVGNPERATKLLGLEIQDSAGRKFAKIKDLAVDLQNGRIAEVIVLTGGWPGVEEKYVALPPGRFSHDEGGKMLHLNLNREQVKAAPAFDRAMWAGRMDSVGIRGVYQHYEMVPYFARDELTVENAPLATPKAAPDIVLPRIGYIGRASKVMGMPVRNLQDERLGKVENLIVDVPSGRVIEVIVATGGFMGIGDELSAVPPQSLRLEPGQNRLRLDTTREELDRAPHFKSGEWPNLADARHVSAVYHAYGIEPYFNIAEPDETSANPRDRHAPDAVIPFDQNASESDRAIGARIRKEIIARRGLSDDARNVKVVTVNGQVTLRGPVKSEQEASILIDIAKRAVAQNSTVENQIEVKPRPDSD